MKPRYLLIVLLLVRAVVSAQVPGNVISRVFEIREGDETGSMFLFDFGGQQYFVTAQHMVSALGVAGSVDVLANDANWHPIKVRILHGNSPCNDVAVLIPDPAEKVALKIDDLPVHSGWYFGQETYFLGFPYGLYTYFRKLAEKHPVPLIKHGYVSAKVGCDSMYPGADPDKSLILLDGMNNPGFSGGPVVGPDLDTPGHPLKLIGVVSGFRIDPLRVKVNGQDAASASVAANSGIVLVVPIEEVTALIEADRKPKK